MSTNVLTTEQMMNLLNTDYEFGINFVIDNNPTAVQGKIDSLGLPLSANPSNLQIREAIDDLMLSDDSDKWEKLKEITEVFYDDTNPNYTGGFANDFAQMQTDSPNAVASGGIIITAITGFLQAGANAYAGWTNMQVSQDQLEMQENALAQQWAMFQDSKIMGIPQTTFIAILGFILAVLVIMSMNKKK